MRPNREGYPACEAELGQNSGKSRKFLANHSANIDASFLNRDTPRQNQMHSFRSFNLRPNQVTNLLSTYGERNTPMPLASIRTTAIASNAEKRA